MARGNKIDYEWCAETIDEYGDVHEVRFEDKLSDLLPLEDGEELVLVKNFWAMTHIEGAAYLYEKTYWYPSEDSFFCNGDSPPKKYVQECAKEDWNGDHSTSHR